MKSWRLEVETEEEVRRVHVVTVLADTRAQAYAKAYEEDFDEFLDSEVVEVHDREVMGVCDADAPEAIRHANRLKRVLNTHGDLSIEQQIALNTAIAYLEKLK